MRHVVRPSEDGRHRREGVRLGLEDRAAPLFHLVGTRRETGERGSTCAQAVAAL